MAFVLSAEFDLLHLCYGVRWWEGCDGGGGGWPQSKAMNSFGYQIVQALVTDIVPDGKVREAMNDINAAQRLRCPPPPSPPSTPTPSPLPVRSEMAASGSVLASILLHCAPPQVLGTKF